MTENLEQLAAELSRVDEAIAVAPLYAEPGNPLSGFSDELVELVLREEEVVDLLAQSARDRITGE
ncbi:hypothetical protein [Propionicimonas sp.]|uniref:hypothetical protein n=1 Tax=Propionicimonas sp. TaxID=1955623 RepID=UPI0039E6D8B1